MCSERIGIAVCVRGLAALCALALPLAGCQPQRTALQEDFGQSVRAMIHAQTLRPGEATPALDGDKARAALRVYRESVSKPEQVREDVIISVGGRR